jgi:hypothetical protein
MLTFPFLTLVNKGLVSPLHSFRIFKGKYEIHFCMIFIIQISKKNTHIQPQPNRKMQKGLLENGHYPFKNRDQKKIVSNYKTLMIHHFIK